MTTEDLTTRKRIPVNRIKLGMFVVGLDRSWLETPFIFHRKLIKSDADIELLKRHGIHEVIIDTAQGVDLAVENDALERSEDRDRASSDVAPTTASSPSRKPSEAEIAFPPLAKELSAAQSIHAEAISAAQIIFDGARGGTPVKHDVAEQVVRNLNDSILRSPEANLLLMQARRFDHDLFTHAVNVCVLALVVNSSEAIGVDPSALGLGALLHDIGETRLPRNLIRKQDALTDVELQLVEQHPKLGQVLLTREQFPEIVRAIALEHHERVDGSGYPQRAKGEAIQLASQIVAITDLYDDMFTSRNQRMLAPIEVLRRLFLQSNAGTLDKLLVEKIIRCLGVYPIGGLVELSTGERAIVVATNKSDALKPTVRIISSRSGLKQTNGPVVSLADAASVSLERRVVNALDPGRERINLLEFLKPAPARREL